MPVFVAIVSAIDAIGFSIPLSLRFSRVIHGAVGSQVIGIAKGHIAGLHSMCLHGGLALLLGVVGYLHSAVCHIVEATHLYLALGCQHTGIHLRCAFQHVYAHTHILCKELLLGQQSGIFGIGIGIKHTHFRASGKRTYLYHGVYLCGKVPVLLWIHVAKPIGP